MAIDHKEFGKDFDPSNWDFDRNAVVEVLKKVALQSSQNLKRNADAFLSDIYHDNNKLFWPGEKRTSIDKFALTY